MGFLAEVCPFSDISESCGALLIEERDLARPPQRPSYEGQLITCLFVTVLSKASSKT